MDWVTINASIHLLNFLSVESVSSDGSHTRITGGQLAKHSVCEFQCCLEHVLSQTSRECLTEAVTCSHVS